MKRRLIDSEVYNQLVANSKLLSTINLINPTLDKIPDEKISDSIDFISKKFNFDFKVKILDYLREGKLILVMNSDRPLPRFINIFGKVYNGKPIVVIDISAYATMNKDENISIYPKTLYGLLQSGMILYDVTTKFSKLETNATLAMYSAKAYSKLICHVLDKMLGININPTRSDIAYFLVIKFFLKAVYGYEDREEAIDEIASKLTINKTSLEFLKEMEDTLNREVLYKDFFSFLNEMKKLEGFRQLQRRSFVDQYLRQYGEASILSIDYLPSFLSLILGTDVAAGINKDYIIDSICGKENRKISMEIAKIL